MSSTKPTILLVPGAWHPASAYDLLVADLTSHGYKTEAISLPSVGPDPAKAPSMSLQNDIDHIRSSLTTHLQSSNVVVICHSYAGVPTQAACTNLSTTTPTTSGKLLGIGMISSFLLPPQTSMISFVGGPAPIHAFDPTTNLVTVGPPGPQAAFYNDLPDPLAAQHAARLQPHVWSTKTAAPAEKSLAYLDGVPTSYLVCELDQAILPAWQRGMIAGAEKLMAEGGVEGGIRVESCGAGHSPFLSMPARTGEFVRRCAGEDVPI